MFDMRLSKRTKHRPSSTTTKEIIEVFDRMFDGFQISPNTIKQHQTRCPNVKMFVQRTMFDSVWSPNISRLARPLATILRAWTNDKCLATKHHQTLPGNQTFYSLDTLFSAV